MREAQNKRSGLFVRNFIFGIEDSIVSTVGLLSGIAIAEVPPHTILLTGFVLIFVEAFSMGTGSFLSESSAEDYEMQREVPLRRSITAALVMFFSYFISGFIPLFPYVLFPPATGLIVSVVFSLIALFLLGVWSAIIANIRIWRSGIQMFVIGGASILIGILVGGFLNIK